MGNRTRPEETSGAGKGIRRTQRIRRSAADSADVAGVQDTDREGVGVVSVRGDSRRVRTARPVVTKDRQSAKGHLRAVPLGTGVPNLTSLVSELQDMTDILLGREQPPIDAGHLTLMEVADAYFARASEITLLLQKAEREGQITKGSAHYRFRTGELRTFMEMARRAAELGSRRLTEEQLHWEMQMYGRESKNRNF